VSADAKEELLLELNSKNTTRSIKDFSPEVIRLESNLEGEVKGVYYATFYATDDAKAATEVERLIRVAGFDPVPAGGVAKAGRIEVGGDLHPYGGLNGRLVDRDEASLLVTPAERTSVVAR